MLQIKQAHLFCRAHGGIYLAVHKTTKYNSIPTCQQEDRHDTVSKANVKNARARFYSFITGARDRPRKMLIPYKGRICSGRWRLGTQHPSHSSPAPLPFPPEEDIIMSKWHEAVGPVLPPAPQGLFFFSHCLHFALLLATGLQKPELNSKGWTLARYWLDTR